MSCSADCTFSTDRTKEHLLHHIRANIPTKITFAEINLLPSRKDFVNPKFAPAFAAAAAKRAPLLFMPNSVNEHSEWTGGVCRLKYHIYGVLPCGSKAAVILDEVPVFFNVMVPDGWTPDKFRYLLQGALNAQPDTKYTGITMTHLYRPRGFQKTKRAYLTVTSNNLQDRRKCLTAVIGMGYETADDDLSNYFAKTAREFKFACADWVRLDTYDVTQPLTQCAYTFIVKCANYKRLSKQKRRDLAQGPLASVLEKDPLMVGQWDIETYSTIQNGAAPTPADPNFTIFCICSAYFHHHSDAMLLGVCCVETEADAHPKTPLTIVCGCEENVLRAHMRVMGSMSHDILAAFNGSKFDWPLYAEKCKRYGLLEELKSQFVPITRRDTPTNIMKYNFKSEQMKISAEVTHEMDCVACFPGFIDTDVQPIFLKLYSRAEVRKAASLNFFLAKNKLESKEDMPYKTMFQIYEKALSNREKGIHDDPENTARMADVGYYCLVDCIRPQQLYVARTIIQDRREIANMAYVSLYDAFYRADGMKVSNCIAAECWKQGVAYSSRKPPGNERDKYPGAWVFPPNRGLHADDVVTTDSGEKQGRPITGLDFASLYPSLMMTYNLSYDMTVKDKATADALMAEGYELHHTPPFEYERSSRDGGETRKLVAEGWVVRHKGIFSQNDTRTIAGYTKCIDGAPAVEYYGAGKTVVLNDIPTLPSSKITYAPIYGRDKLPGERMGIFAIVVKKIFDKRVPVKAEFVRLSIKRESMEQAGATKEELREITYLIAKVNAKQTALKLLANTIYGMAGNSMASIYELCVAAGITSAGQYNIKAVNRFVRSKGFTPHYGDTDSLYISCPDTVFAECDARYRAAIENMNPEDTTGRKTAARIEWWTEQVAISMKVMTMLQRDVTDFLLCDNGTLFLKMAYEEVGFPTVFCGKKKYFMTPHVETINFSPKEYFVKGIDIVKQGQAPVTKQLGYEFIAAALSPENECTLLELAERCIRKFHASKYDPKMFVMTARYKPDKKNVPVHTFVARMAAKKAAVGDPVAGAIYEPPEAGDKFEYVVVKKSVDFGMSGRRVVPKKGDQMEYLSVFNAYQGTPNALEIDLNYYMKSFIVGLFARFVAYHPDFQPPAGMYDVRDKDQYQCMDKYCVDKAAKYLSNISDTYSGHSPEALTETGRKYRSIHAAVTKRIQETQSSIQGGVCLNEVSNGTCSEIVEQFVEMARKYSVDAVDTSVLFERLSVFELKRIYCGLGSVVQTAQQNTLRRVGLAKHRVTWCDAQEKIITGELRGLAPDYSDVVKERDQIYETHTMLLRAASAEESVAILENLGVALAAVRPDVLREAHLLSVRLIAIYKIRANMLKILGAVTEAVAKINPPAPSRVELANKAAVDSGKIAVLDDHKWS